MQGLKQIFDTDFEYRLKPLKTEMDTKTENKIVKINTGNQNRNLKRKI